MDRVRLRDVRATPPHMLGARAFGFADRRCEDLLFRYRARNYPETLSLEESARWDAFRRTRLTTATDATALTLEDYFREISVLRDGADGRAAGILYALEQWGRQIV